MSIWRRIGVNSKKVLILFIFIILFGVLLMESKVIYKFLYFKKYLEYVEKYLKEFNLDENIVYSVIKVESKFNSFVVLKKEVKGLM